MAEAKTSPQLEAIRAQVGRSLPSSCADDFQRLSRTLVYGPAFQWLLVDAPQEGLRKQVMAALEQVLKAAGMHSNRLPLSDKITDVATLEQRLLKNADQAQVVHLVGRPGWFTPERWDAFNVRRERLAAQSNARLVFWLDAEAIELASRGAPDLWAWRGGVYRFESTNTVSPSFLDDRAANANDQPYTRDTLPFVSKNGTHEERMQRIAEIQNWLAQIPAPPDELLTSPVLELERLLYSMQDYEAALAHCRKVALPLHERLDDARSKAITMGQIADIQIRRGQFDEALHVLEDEVLPAFDRLGDIRSKAVTMGKIADIKQAQGHLEDALRIRQHDELPVYMDVGDLREQAVAMTKVATIVGARGQVDEELRIYQNDVLPIFQRLEDTHAIAVTKGNIADILKSQGQLDEALRIRQEEVLPVYERLGDMRSKAVTLGKVADILKMRGQLDEALSIYRDQVLPVFERQGDVRGKAVTMGKIAGILAASGQLDEAVRIRRDEELPVYERLQVHRDLLICQTNLALLYIQRGEKSDLPQVDSLLRAAYRTAQEMEVPEAEQIVAIYRNALGKELTP